jgi:hypothetical protein
VAQVTKNALKGYTYQQYIFLLFMSLMDTDRKISSLEIEATTLTNFDDMVVNESGLNYWIQVKNYPDTQLEDIEVLSEKVRIKTNYSQYDSQLNNVVIINTDKIASDGTTIFGLQAVKVGDIWVIPLTPYKIENILNSLFSSETRLIKIVNFSYELCISWQGKVEVSELPSFARLSTDLEQKTVLLRDTLSHIDEGITCIVGKPGVGKSHYVKELSEQFPCALIYRFWVGSQDSKQFERLSFNNFLNDIASEIFKSLRRFTIEELINAIENIEYPIIIDGLDHVENYNPTEFHQFVEFINPIEKARVIILTRPLTYEILWTKIILDNWNKDETFLYLKEAHQIDKYSISDKIYNISNGYPIITYFLSEHYKKYGILNLTETVTSIESYYSELLKDVKTRDAIGIFLLNDSFLQREEVIKLCANDTLSGVIMSFVSDYPYLFKHTANRISLIHNSLNTYLRSVCNVENWKNVVDKIKASISKKEIRYLSRFASFNFDDDFISEVLRTFSDMTVYEELILSNFDFASVQEFYGSLRRLLDFSPNTLDEYQYYSFILICLMAERNNMVGCDSLIYQVIINAKEKGIDEKDIFSSGYFWCVFLFLKYDNRINHNRFMNENNYSDASINSAYWDFKKEHIFFNALNESFDPSKAWNKFIQSGTEIKKRNILENYMVKIWIHKIYDNSLYSILQRFLHDENDTSSLQELQTICAEFEISDFMARWILNGARYKLWELGLIRDNNPFLEIDTKKIISNYAPKGSFTVSKYLVSYLRLAGYEGRTVDLNSVSLFWNMYHNRKDYSVISLDDALLVFERKGLVKDEISFDLIVKVMGQSEKGIHHLLHYYINKKGITSIEGLKINEKLYNGIDDVLDVLDLEPYLIDEIDEPLVSNRLQDLMNYHYRSRAIQYSEIQNVVRSKYGAIFLDVLNYHGYHITDVPMIDMRWLQGIKFELESKQDERPKDTYIPFENGNIHRRDFKYIRDNKIHYLDIASYTDGWYACFPYISVYEFYDKRDLQQDALKIIHSALSAKIKRLDMAGDWRLCLGTIPEFFELIEHDVDWNKLFSIFTSYLRLSLIDDVLLPAN